MLNFFQKLIVGAFILIPLCGISQEKIDLLLLNQKYSEALTLIDQELQVQPTSSLYVNKGMVYRNLQNFLKAKNAYQEALVLAPKSVSIMVELGEVHSTLGNYYDAADYFQKALAIEPRNLVVSGQLGKTYLNLKDYKNGYEVFNSIYQTDSTNVLWTKQLAFCEAKTGKREQAINHYNMVLEQNPRDLNVYLSLVTLYDGIKNQAEILNLFEQGLSEFPANPQLLEKKANYLFAIKQYPEALEVYKVYVENNQPDYELLKNYGICNYFCKDEMLSIDILEQCVLINSNDPYVYFYLSLGFKKLAEHEVAEGYMKTAIESATPFYLPEMYHHLAQIYGQQRKFEESVEALKTVYEMDPTDFEILFELATTYEEYNSNKTMALNMYQVYIQEGGAEAKNVSYAVERITKIKEDLFFDE